MTVINPNHSCNFFIISIIIKKFLLKRLQYTNNYVGTYYGKTNNFIDN